MSGITGIETAQQLRQNDYSMPIMVLSANAYPSDRLAAINAGCNDFLAKPIQVDELLQKLQLHLGLVWLSEEQKNPNITNTSDSLALPPQSVMEDLIRFVRIGDILGLNRHIDQLTKQAPEYQNFLIKIKKLSSEFRIGEIRKLLQM